MTLPECCGSNILASHKASYNYVKIFMTHHAKVCDITLPEQCRLPDSQGAQLQFSCNTLHHQLSNHQALFIHQPTQRVQISSQHMQGEILD